MLLGDRVVLGRVVVVMIVFEFCEVFGRRVVIFTVVGMEDLVVLEVVTVVD